MAAGDPRTYFISFHVSAERYKEMIDAANKANHPTVESYLRALCQPAPKAEVKDNQVVFHSVLPEAEEPKGKGK